MIVPSAVRFLFGHRGGWACAGHGSSLAKCQTGRGEPNATFLEPIAMLPISGASAAIGAHCPPLILGARCNPYPVARHGHRPD